jgi:hypothetical protein
MWFLALPFAYVMGIRSPAEVAYVLVPIGLAGAFSAIAIRRPRIYRSWQIAIMCLAMTATIALSRFLGPLVLTPTMVATYTIVLQAHPGRTIRRIALAIGTATMILPVLLEAIGVLPSSYGFGPNGVTIHPQMVELTPLGTTAILLGGSLAMMLVPCVFIARLRSSLTDAQRKQLVAAAHFKRLNADLVNPAA